MSEEEEREKGADEYPYYNVTLGSLGVWRGFVFSRLAASAAARAANAAVPNDY